MLSFEFFIDIILSIALWLWVGSVSNRNEYQEDFLGVNASGAWGWQPYHLPVPLSWNLGTLTSWNPLGHSRPVMGLLWLFKSHKNKGLSSWILTYLYVISLCSGNVLYYMWDTKWGGRNSWRSPNSDYEVQPETEEKVYNLNKIIEHYLTSTCCAEQNSLTKIWKSL
jgi:hypothetical protein